MEKENYTPYNAFVPCTVDQLPWKMTTITTCREIDKCPFLYMLGLQKFLQKIKIRELVESKMIVFSYIKETKIWNYLIQ